MPAKQKRKNLLDPKAISRGEALGLMARNIVEGYRVGEHRSPFNGFAIEFSQHREYTAGDDVRHLDWKILGRTDKYYIKQYEQDTNFICTVVMDGSDSMNFGSGEITKLDYAKVLAACFSYITLSQRDASAVGVFDSRLSLSLSPTDSLGKIHTIMQQLSEFEATGETNLRKSLEDVSLTLKGKGIVIVISDLLDDEEAFQKGIERLRFQGHEVIVFHVMDHEELEFSMKGTVKFIGLEGLPTLQTVPADIRKGYMKALEEFKTKIRRVCEVAGCHYTLADTSHPVHETLSAYLAFRQRSAAVRGS
jgi:uncharacterized protein (DUF58 family)